MEQQKEVRKGTWYHGVKKILMELKIEEDPKEVTKSKWKAMVKSKIREMAEKDIRSKCAEMSKARSIIKDKYEMAEYLKETNVKDASGILKMRLHMTNIPCNFKNGGSECWLCGRQDIRSEHYFTCYEMETIRKCWNTKEDKIQSNYTIDLLKASKFIQQVEKKSLGNPV